MGYIGSACMVLVGIVFMTSSTIGKLALPGWMGFAYVIIGAIYIIPSRLLHQYGSSIGRLVRARDMFSLVDAVTHQKSFWRFVGIFTLLIIGLYLLVIVGAFFIGLSR